jgi:hypothetical protein
MKLRVIKRRAKTRYVATEGFKFLRDCMSKRCRTYVSGCATCDTWRFFDENKRFTRNFEELQRFMKLTEGENK